MKTVDFSKSIAASDLIVSRSIHLIEYMKVQILKTPFTLPKIHPGCKFAPGVQIYTRVQIAHMNEALDRCVNVIFCPVA